MGRYGESSRARPSVIGKLACHVKTSPVLDSKPRGARYLDRGTTRWNSRAPARQGPSPEERHPCTRYTPRCGRANAFQPSCLVRVRRASPWRKGKRKSGRPEAPMRPLCAGARRRASPVSFSGAKQGSIRCASPLPDSLHTRRSFCTALGHTHTRFARAPPFPPPPISFTWFSTHLLPPLTQPSFHSSCAPPM